MRAAAAAAAAASVVHPSVARLPNTWSWPWAAVLIALVFASYASVIATAGWIWDDAEYVTRNPVLNGGFDNGLWRIWTDMSATPQYYPLVHTSFWIEWQVFPSVLVTEHGQKILEPNPTGFHLDNVLLMALTTLLFWRLLLRLKVPGAWFAAALFAVHPINVESVAWVTERKNMLSGLFALATMNAYLRYAGIGGAEAHDSLDSRKLPTWVAAVCWFLAGLGSKTVIAFVPPAILLLIWWRRPQVWRRHLLPLSPLFAVGVLAGLNTARLEVEQVAAGIQYFDLTVLDRCLLAGRITWSYFWHLVCPIEQIFSYPKWQPDAGSPLQWGLLIGVFALLATAVASTRRLGRGPLVAILVFGGALVPVMGFFDVYPFRFSWLADHFQYHADFALFALFGAALVRATAPLPATVKTITGILLLVVLGVLTARQGFAYRDRETIWRDTIKKNPESWIAHSNLGELLRTRGEIAAARALFVRGQQIHPDARFLASLGAVELDLFDRDQNPQHLDRSIHWGEQALASKPDLSMARAMVAGVYGRKGPQFRAKVIEHLEQLRKFVLAERLHATTVARKFQNPLLRSAMEQLHRAYGAQGRAQLAAGDHRSAYLLFKKSDQPFGRPHTTPWSDLYTWTTGSPWFRLELQQIWLLATSTDPTVHDPAQAATEFAEMMASWPRKMNEAKLGPGPRAIRTIELMDLHAAVLAATGRFDDATRIASQAARRAFANGAPTAWVREVEARRDQYGKQQPFRLGTRLPFASGR